ncbi:uracil-DNA glycosylase family protein [Marinoscillum sp.]|uniref:uracil-DNA glycosylase family protein n=1 Tax=Marinoscillum sp. TaxID=2024838 RepID=UPI003BACE10F
MTVADKILSFYQSLTPPPGLPPEVVVLNPYKDEQAMEASTLFYRKYYDDQQERIVLFGINPGRFGGGLTGVPFTDPIHLEESCGIKNELDKRPELSSKFIYEVIAAYGGPDLFYQKLYLSAVSPLGFVRDGRNLNYYDIADWPSIFEQYALECIQQQLALPLSRKVAFSIGQGENLKFLNVLNDKYHLFDEILTVPHPRWVMQYRLKRKVEFVNQYLERLSKA